MLIRNHRWFLVATYGAARVGAKLILLNSEFSGPQIKEVSEREGAEAHHLRRRVHQGGRRRRARARQAARARHQPRQRRAVGERRRDAGRPDRQEQQSTPPPKASAHSKIIILTSGTTGTPKGANRSSPPSLAPIGGVLSHVPFKGGEVTSLPAPMFHALGYLHATIAMLLGQHAGAAPEVQAADGARRHREARGDRAWSSCR